MSNDSLTSLTCHGEFSLGRGGKVIFWEHDWDENGAFRLFTHYPYTVAVADKNYFIKHYKKHFFLYNSSETENKISENMPAKQETPSHFFGRWNHNDYKKTSKRILSHIKCVGPFVQYVINYYVFTLREMRCCIRLQRNEPVYFKMCQKFKN